MTVRSKMLQEQPYAATQRTQMATAHGSGGFEITQEMQQLITRPILPANRGGNTLRLLYQRRINRLNTNLVSDFAKWCYYGDIRAIRHAVESGDAPDILGSETPYGMSYPTFVIRGAFMLAALEQPITGDHAATLKYLLDLGAPPNLPDLLGYTALHHACMVRPRAEFVRALLAAGADPNAQDRFGCVALMGAFQNDAVQVVDLLMEHGARLDLQDADGDTPDDFFIKAGPSVTAAVQRWKRKRAGETQPLDEKACATCGKTDVALKLCARCGAIRYCSQECQKSDWRRHKLACVAFTEETTVTVTPFYEDIGPVIPAADIQRQQFGYPVAKQSKRNTRSMHIPTIRPGETRKFIIKVQVPFDMNTGMPEAAETGDLVVFDRKRSLACRIRRQDNPEGYLRISRTVVAKGVFGAKAYFPAEMQQPDKLVVKVSEVLAEQAF